MKAQWQALEAKFTALNLREKRMTVGAVMLLVGFVGYSVGVEPALIKSRLLTRQLAQQQAELKSLAAQRVDLQARFRDPDAANRTALAEAQARLAALNAQLHGYDAALVPPEQMPRLLQSLLNRHRGLELVSLRTLAVAPLVSSPIQGQDGAKSSDGGGQKVMPGHALPAGSLFRHSIELKVAGRYQELQGYLAELEASPQKLLWERMSLVVQAYPRSELTLRLYTLSLDSIWLVV